MSQTPVSQDLESDIKGAEAPDGGGVPWRLLRRGRPWAVALILLVAVLARLPGINPERSLWVDETISMTASRNSQGYLPWLYEGVYGASVNSSLVSYHIFRLADWLLTWGSLPLAKLPFLLMGVASVAAGWWIGRIWRWWPASIAIALGLAVWPFKVYWDTHIRFYSGIMLFMVTLLAVWEWYRRRPSWRRFLPVVVLSLLAPLNSMQTLPFIGIPWLYIGFGFLSRFVRWGKGGWGWKCGLRSGAIVLIEAAVLLGATCGILWLSRGDAWSRDRAHEVALAIGLGKGADAQPSSGPAMSEIQGSKDQQRIVADLVAFDPVSNKRYADLKAPSIGQMVHFFRVALPKTFSPKSWSLAPLLGLGGRYSFFDELVLFDTIHPTRPGDLFNLILIIFVLLGSGVLLFRSPPLLASLWMLILGISVSLYYRWSIPFYNARYYTVAGMALLLLASVGAAHALYLPAWIVARFRKRLAGRALLATGWLFLLVGAVTAWPLAHRSAGFEFQRWGDLFHRASDLFPEGFYLSGYDSQYFEVYQDVDIFHYDRSGQSDYWHSPRRRVIAQDNEQWTPPSPLALIEQASTMQGFVFYDYGAGKYDPLREAQAWLGAPVKEYYRPLTAYFYDASHSVCVTRGQLTLPMRESFLQATEVGSGAEGVRYEIQTTYEVPGQYVLDISKDPDNPLTGLVADGQNLSASLISSPDGQGGAPVDSICWTERKNRQLPTIAQHPAIRPEAGQPKVFSLDRGYSITLPPAQERPMQTQTITLVYRRPIGERRPLLRWSRINSAWSVRSQQFDVGEVALYGENQSLCLTPVLMLNAPSKTLISPSIALFDVKDQKTILSDRLASGIERQRDRFFSAGDLCLGPTLKISPQLAMQLVGKELAVTVTQGDPQATYDWISPPAGAGAIQAGGATHLPLRKFILVRNGNAFTVKMQ